MKNTQKFFAIPTLLVLGASLSSAAVAINGNFCSVANIQTLPAGQVSGAGAWNDLTATNVVNPYSATDTTYGSLAIPPKNDLKYTDGTDVSSAVSISWNSLFQDTNDNRGTAGYSTNTGSEQMFAGYLSSGTTITLTLGNFDQAFAGEYAVYLYLDTDTGTAGDPVDYSVSSNGDFTTGGGQVYYGSDAEDYIDDTVSAAFNRVTSTTPGTYMAGNFVLFEGMSGSGTFTITRQGGGALVGLNGFEIVPEPASLALFGIGGAFALLRRRRTA